MHLCEGHIHIFLSRAGGRVRSQPAVCASQCCSAHILGGPSWRFGAPIPTSAFYLPRALPADNVRTHAAAAQKEGERKRTTLSLSLTHTHILTRRQNDWAFSSKAAAERQQQLKARTTELSGDIEEIFISGTKYDDGCDRMAGDGCKGVSSVCLGVFRRVRASTYHSLQTRCGLAQAGMARPFENSFTQQMNAYTAPQL